MQFKFGKLKPLEINWVPTRILILFFSIFFNKFLVSFFLLRKSLDKILIFFSGKFVLILQKFFLHQARTFEIHN